ncbi:MAG TPA: hypothetical protein VNI36_04460 [Candidatus Dormibacteraeota bacterium]|nr:hypothetical protein [Candidatus Dormibacteraeota bacterium]
MPREAEISGALREEARLGRATQERKLAICSGAASLEPEDRIELLTILAADSDEAIRKKAAAMLLTQPLPSVLSALKRTGAAPEMFAYCAAEFPRRPGVADALARNLTCPIEVLRPVVRYLSVSAVQELFEDLDRLSMSPALVAELIASSVITNEQRIQLLELQREDTESEDAFADAAEAIEPDKAKRETLVQRLSRMRVVERVQMALKGGRDERTLLIRDPCKVVQRAVLQSPQLSEREVESFAGMASLSEEALRLIATNRKFRKNYTIVRSLMFNPKTPLEITLHLLPTITAKDLKMLTTNKNIPDTLRTASNRLQRQRTSTRER